MALKPALKVWFDFNCPYCHTAGGWIRNLEEQEALPFEPIWKAFSLENVNLPPEGDADELWARPEERRGLLPLAISKWAESEGPETFGRVFGGFLQACHEEGKKIGKPEVCAEVLNAVGLEGTPVVDRVLGDRKWLDSARSDYEEGRELGVFGVPTLVFPDAKPIYMKMNEITENERAVELFEKVQAIATDSTLQELKRPSPPRR
ncbi:MAG: DsbA family oxidoreductase [Acidimicrobiia bacterium]